MGTATVPPGRRTYPGKSTWRCEVLVNKQLRLAESTAERSRGVTRLCVQHQGYLGLSCLLSLRPQDVTHSAHEDMEQAHAKQGPKECVEKAYLTSLSGWFVMMRL